jgi:hypothetical protein
MPNTYTLIQSITVGAGGASSINFDYIPQNFTDLILKVSARSSASGTYDSLGLYLNGVQSNRTRIVLVGEGSPVYTNSSTYRDIAYINGNTSTSNLFSNAEVYIFNYSSSSFKCISSDSVYGTHSSTSSGLLTIFGGLWSSTEPITSISLDNATSGLSYLQHSSFSLYGITKS